MPGWESWRFHAKDSAEKGPCRRRCCFQCWRYRLVVAWEETRWG